MTGLPQFVSDDPSQVTAELVESYEETTGRTLYPGQVERLLIDLIAYRETLVRSAINETARQNLVAFARKPMLDYLGELVGVTRLPAQSASATVRITFETPLAEALLVPAGLRVETAGGTQFQTQSEILVPNGSLAVDLAVLAVEPGAAGNGYIAGKVNALVDDLAVDVAGVTNLAVTVDGSEEEDDDPLRERIKLAPESFSNAGSRQAYRFHALKAHQSIVDVAVLSPAPGKVHLYPLVSTGLPDANILSLVNAMCSDERVRPLTDQVVTQAPSQVNYVINAELTYYSAASLVTALAQANAAAAAFVADRAAGLGRDVVPSQISAMLSVPGVYSVVLNAPAMLTLAENEWANCTGISLTVAGIANG